MHVSLTAAVQQDSISRRAKAWSEALKTDPFFETKTLLLNL